MTVSEAVIRWLKRFGDEQPAMREIDTEVQSAEEFTYSLVREPVQNVKAYLSGKKVYTDHYTLQARLPSRYDPGRIANNSFGEELEEWIREKDRSGDLPEIEGARVERVSITTPFYVGRSGERNSVYQMTIAIKYERENRDVERNSEALL